MCISNTVKTKEIQFLSFSRKIRPFLKKFLYHQLPNMTIHTHTKFAPLDFINKKVIGKCRFFTQTEHPLHVLYFVVFLISVLEAEISKLNSAVCLKLLHVFYTQFLREGCFSTGIFQTSSRRVRGDDQKTKEDISTFQ